MCYTQYVQKYKKERSANMANIVSFVVCDAINNVFPNGEKSVPALVAPQIALRPQFIPSSFSFGAAVGVAGIDLKIENKIRMTISDPEANIIYTLGENGLPRISVEDTMPQAFQGFMLAIDIRNLPIQSEGEYEFSLYLNDECIGVQKIPVFKRA